MTKTSLSREWRLNSALVQRLLYKELATITWTEAQLTPAYTTATDVPRLMNNQPMQTRPTTTEEASTISTFRNRAAIVYNRVCITSHPLQTWWFPFTSGPISKWDKSKRCWPNWRPSIDKSLSRRTPMHSIHPSNLTWEKQSRTINSFTE